jgi:hypothetical protein
MLKKPYPVPMATMYSYVVTWYSLSVDHENVKITLLLESSMPYNTYTLSLFYGKEFVITVHDYDNGSHNTHAHVTLTRP